MLPVLGTTSCIPHDHSVQIRPLITRWKLTCLLFADIQSQLGLTTNATLAQVGAAFEAKLAALLLHYMMIINVMSG